MTIFPKQRANLFVAAMIAGLAGGALSTGMAHHTDPLFSLLLGAAVALAGAVQIYQELTQPPAPGSSDLLLGTVQVVFGAALALHAKTAAAATVRTAVYALVIFYALTVLQLAANQRAVRKKFAALFALAGAVPFVMAVLPLLLPLEIAPAYTLYAACIALAIAAVSVTFLLPFEQQKLKEQTEKLAAAEKKAEKPAPKPLTPEEQAAKEEADRRKAEKAAQEAAARKAAEQARKAQQAKEDAEAEAEAMNLLAGLGGLAGKAKKKVTSTVKDTAKSTVAAFQEGKNGTDGTGK